MQKEQDVSTCGPRGVVLLDRAAPWRFEHGRPSSRNRLGTVAATAIRYKDFDRAIPQNLPERTLQAALFVNRWDDYRDLQALVSHVGSPYLRFV
jgi:C4-dicarboxylate-specific signal transduction histidine kinase